MPIGVAVFALLLMSLQMPAASTRDSDFDALVNDFLPKYWKEFPTEATGAGVHTYDGELEDLTSVGINRKLELFRDTLGRLNAIPTRSLSLDHQIDREIVRRMLEWQILDYDRLRSWTKSPGLYNELASGSVFLLLIRESAPQAERARFVTSRLQKFSALFGAARVNLTSDTPALAIETAVRDTKGTITFLNSAVREFLGKSPASDTAVAGAANAAEDYIRFLEQDLAARAKGRYGLDPKLYRLKSATLNHVDLAPETIAQRGLAEVRRIQAEMKRVAAEVAPGKSLADALVLAAADHPSPADLIPTYKARQRALKEFVVERKLVTIPPDDKLDIMETPEFARSMISAAVFTAGPFETRDLTTYYVVTPIDASRSAAEQEGQLREHALAAIDVVSIHEAYPGHHVQLLKAREVPSPVRKLVGNGVYVEGWAHYTEEMMIDQGYGNGDPKLRLCMLKDALLRACRMYVDPLVGTRKKTYEEAKDFYAREGYQSTVTAEMEARRVALSPATVYIYTVGKLWIKELAAAERKKLGPAFQLGAFHDKLLSYGAVPLPMLAKDYFGVALNAR